jgi:CHAT domain-containing protein
MKPLSADLIFHLPAVRSKLIRLLLNGLLPIIGLIPVLFKTVTTAQDQHEKLAQAILGAHTAEERKALLVAKPELEVALVKLGNSRYQEGKYEDALVAYSCASSIADGLHDFEQGAFISVQIGNVYSVQGKYRLSLEYYQKALQLAQVGNDKQQMVSARIGIGSANYWLGLYELALDQYQSSLVLANELQQPSLKASSLLGIGLVHYARGEYQGALQSYRQALRYGKEANDESIRAEASVNIGILHHKQGDYDQALFRYHQAQMLFEKLDDKESLVGVFHNIGQVRQRQAKYGAALENYRHGLSLSEQLGNKVFISRGLLDVGYLHYEKRQFRQALSYYQKALHIAEEADAKETLGVMLVDIANAYHSLGNFGEALQFANRAVGVAQEVGSLESLWQAFTAAGKAYKALGEISRSAQAFDQAITIVEQLRGQVAGGQPEQERFFENKLVPFQEMVDLAVGQNHLTDALSFSERGKSRVLLDRLTTPQSATSFQRLTKQDREEQERLNRNLVLLNGQIYAAMAQSTDPVKMSHLNAQLQKARLEYEAFGATLATPRPVLKALSNPSLITSDEAGQLIGNTSTGLLEYTVLEEKTYLLLITKAATGEVRLRSYKVPLRERQLAKLVAQFREKIAARALDFHPLAAQLYQLLLEPAHQQLRDVNTLCIVPDGVLWELPFQALQPAQDEYLLDRFAVFYAPSLTVLREMQPFTRANRTRLQNKQNTLLAFASPESKVDQTRTDSPVKNLSELAVQAIREVYGPGRSVIFTRSAATEARAKSEMGNYSVLQFFTHGLLDDRRPLYSALMLSPGEKGTEDGMLEAREVMDLKLNADLAVLSACETAGRAGRGEGLIGISWAFLVAGCPSVVVSQWKVGTLATKELMVEFHRQLMRSGAAPISKAQALRKAALKVRNTTLLQHPYSWAGFILVGSNN